MERASREELLFDDYLARTTDESQVAELIAAEHVPFALVVVQGFEDRAIAALQLARQGNWPLRSIFLAQYPADIMENQRLAAEFETLLLQFAPVPVAKVPLTKDGEWLMGLRLKLKRGPVLVDITGLSTRHLFGALDAISRLPNQVYALYSEAHTYWPTHDAWAALSSGRSSSERIAEQVDRQPWLFGLGHVVEPIPNHDGYDSCVAGRALIAFLPFKCARLAAIIGEQDYREIIFVAGRPRLAENSWREEALSKINEPLLAGRSSQVMNTVGYRNAVKQLGAILFSRSSPLLRLNVDVAILGSKLQTVGCWAVSCLCPSITFLTASPREYFPESFSEGVGETYYFRVVAPK